MVAGSLIIGVILDSTKQKSNEPLGYQRLMLYYFLVQVISTILAIMISYYDKKGKKVMSNIPSSNNSVEKIILKENLLDIS